MWKTAFCIVSNFFFRNSVMQEKVFALFVSLCYQSQLILNTERSTCSVFIGEANSGWGKKLPCLYGLALRIFYFVPHRIGCHSLVSFQLWVATAMKGVNFQNSEVFKKKKLHIDKIIINADIWSGHFLAFLRGNVTLAVTHFIKTLSALFESTDSWALGSRRHFSL